MVVSIFPPKVCESRSPLPYTSHNTVYKSFKNFANLVRNIQSYVYSYCFISMETKSVLLRKGPGTEQLLPNMSQLVKEAEIEAVQGAGGGGVAC